MKRKTLLKILHDMQKWRRGGGVMPHSPKLFGAAIDDCIRILRKMDDKNFNELINDKTERGNIKAVQTGIGG